MRGLIVVSLAATLVAAACGTGAQPQGPGDPDVVTSPAVEDGAAAPTVDTSDPRGAGATPATTLPSLVTPDPDVEPVPAPPPGESAPAPSPGEPADLLPTGTVQVALADLASRLGVAEESIDVVIVEEVTWPDGSLGCPQPDRAYTQALVDGYRIVLAHGGVRYHYHGAAGGDPFFCATPSAPSGDGSSFGDV